MPSRGVVKNFKLSKLRNGRSVAYLSQQPPSELQLSQPQPSHSQSLHVPSAAHPHSSHLQSSPQQQAAVLAPSVVPVAMADRPRALVARAATAVNKIFDMIKLSNMMRGARPRV